MSGGQARTEQHHPAAEKAWRWLYEQRETMAPEKHERIAKILRELDAALYELDAGVSGAG